MIFFSDEPNIVVGNQEIVIKFKEMAFSVEIECKTADGEVTPGYYLVFFAGLQKVIFCQIVKFREVNVANNFCSKQLHVIPTRIRTIKKKISVILN